MNRLIVQTPGRRGLTEEGQEAFKNAYNELYILGGLQPSVCFSRRASDAFKGIARLRMKDWASTTRWNASADETGLMGEIAAMRYYGVPAEEAMADFLTGLTGDLGYDLLCGEEKVDCKATRGSAMKFRFNKTNRNRHVATVYLLEKLEEVGEETWIKLLGWVSKEVMRPWLREDDRSYFLRYDTAWRERILQPASLLKPGH